MKKLILSCVCFAALLTTVSAQAKTADCSLYQPGARAVDVKQEMDNNQIDVFGSIYSFHLGLGSELAYVNVVKEPTQDRVAQLEMPYDSKLETAQNLRVQLYTDKGSLIIACTVSGK